MQRLDSSHRKLMLAGASALVLCLAAPSVVFAQQTAQDDQTVEEVVVTGQRAAIQSAQKIKQNAEQLVDSITSTDIGALPDRSVTEALQRVAGVTIARTSYGRDVDRISVEGSGVQVRGLSWVRGELNGRDSFSAKSGRSLSFEDVPPELMAGVDVYKNPSADLVEGGVGGTVNLRTRLPFDSAKRIMAFSADMSIGDMSKKWKPTGSALYSDRWDTNIGELGFLVSLSESELASRTDTISVDPYFARTDLVPGRTVYVPGGFGYRSLDFERVRKGIGAAVQWRPNDQWDAALTFLRSSASQASTERAVGFNPGSSNGPAAGTTFTYDSAGHFLKGTLAQSPGGNSLGSSTLDTRFADRSSVTSDYALKVNYNPNDKWAFSADIQYIYAKTKTVDFTVFNALGSDAAPATLDLTGDLPAITMNNNKAYTSNPASYYLSAAMDHHDRNDASEWAQRFDGAYTFDEGGWLRSFRFGVRNTYRESTTRETTYNWGAVAPSWSAPSINNLASYQGYYELYPFTNYFRGATNLPATFILPTASLVQNYAAGGALVAKLAAANGGWWGTFNGDYDSLTAGGSGGGVNRQKEKTLAAYALLRFGNEVSLWGEGREIDGNIGLRVVKTESEGKGLQLFSRNNTPTVPAAELAFGNGARRDLTGGRDYVSVLPSLNARLKITPQMFLRFAAAKSIVRPDFGQLQPFFSIGATNGYLNGSVCSTSIPDGAQSNCVFQYTATGGNPELKPTRSTQYDLAYEWYFASTGSLTATVFYKDIYNFVTNGVNTVKFTNNGVTRDVLVTQPYNAGHGTIKGFEVAYQQYFSFLPGALKGLGTQANFTYVDSEGARNAASNPYDSSQVSSLVGGARDDLPLEGLSKTSYNVAALYDLGKVSARLAYNWRERFLQTTSAANKNIPAWFDDYGQLDGSIFYTIDDNLKVGFQAVNLTNTKTKVLVSYPGNKAIGLTDTNWVVADRRYSIVLRGTF
ncbi:TonB-dependent receptor [Caulobacter vibrioides]|uniref:TonB-dependent receptor n=1 Tax=Caulobacter vibrioides TaxID=155892 RepID=UPI000BB482E3|nr:TonB-dependent receptor [Caulobacter vibrioides]ATC23758.1 TonB-dependent receptor [Caulobacter vibrioides]AZH11995.1 TonB-dependent receptor [Caulobacter vibrioides]PLR15425.1 TonB-dependent receptor [Caulobacter vibrioides]